MTPTPSPETAVQMQSVDDAPANDLLRVLVDYGSGEHPLEDTQGLSWTIGSKTDDGDWHLAGWDWHRDEFCEGKGEVVGWLPFMDGPPEGHMSAGLSPSPEPLTLDARAMDAALSAPVPERVRVLEEALGGLLAFIGQLTTAEFVDALYEVNVPGLELTTREELIASLDAAQSAAWSALATDAAALGDAHD